MRITNQSLISAPQTPSRKPLRLAAACVSAPTTLATCSSIDTDRSAARALRKPGAPASNTATSPTRALVRQALLSPSRHNTQCWRLKIAEKSMSVAPDLERRCPVVDPDDHPVFVSLDSAAKNRVLAPLATGLHAGPRLDASGDGMIAANLEVTRQRITPLFQAMSERQCARGDYHTPGYFTRRAAPAGAGRHRRWRQRAPVDRNHRGGVVNATYSRWVVHVVASLQDAQIAHHTARLLGLLHKVTP